MRRPRLRLSVRGLMVLVAVAALALGGLRWMERRCLHFTSLAEFHESRLPSGGISFHGITSYSNNYGINIYDEMILSPYEFGRGKRSRDPDPRMKAYWDQFSANQGYHEAMKQKYLWAAARPWLPVAPDPPEPPSPPLPKWRDNH